jgi:hypothetical protein
MSKHYLIAICQFSAVGIVSTLLWAFRDFDGYPFMAGFSLGCVTIIGVMWAAAIRKGGA